MDSSTDSPKKSRLSPITRFFIGVLMVFLGVLGIAVVAIVVAPPAPSPSAARQQPRPQATVKPPLRLGSWDWSVESGYAQAEGQITNTGTASLENVEAVVSWFTKSGSFITSQSTLIEYSPILGGQTSPWKVMAKHNPAMAEARVEFKQMFGGKLEHTTRK